MGATPRHLTGRRNEDNVTQQETCKGEKNIQCGIIMDLCCSADLMNNQFDSSRVLKGAIWVSGPRIRDIKVICLLWIQSLTISLKWIDSPLK